jgi:FtsP/CotA-like multicopper oxidase with cupredoxin domain
MFSAGLVVVWAPLVGCFDPPEKQSTAAQAVGTPSPDQVPLDPATIPKFVNQLVIPRVYAPTVIKDSTGKVIRNEYTVNVQQSTAQMLPPGFPATTVMAYGGNVRRPGVLASDGTEATEFARTVPGPVFENTRGIPTVVHWRNEVTGDHFLPIDTTLNWANPLVTEPPVGLSTFPGFDPFPVLNLDVGQPVPIVTHNHGLVVVPQNDGIADEWFTAGDRRGPGFVSRDYTKPNQQPSTMLFYHDHTMGLTRVNVYAGLAGTAYMIRDPNNPLDQPSSPLPKGEFEIPLMIADREFFTDGELNFPRGGEDAANIKNAYWTPGGDGDVIMVNGKVWPNLNVQRRQYRFRALAAGNGRLFVITLDRNGTTVPFTLIGSDGGYLPQPKTVNSVTISITERADMLVDFSKFPAGTKITMRNADPDVDDPNLDGIIMQFTVQNSQAVTPPAVPPLVARPALPTNAPRRIKTAMIHFDKDDDQLRSIDGLDFTSPPTEFPLIGSTEEWDFVNGGGSFHQIHIHLIEFQLISRQAVDLDGYLKQWDLLNGHLPVTRPIVVDPTPFLVGDPIPPEPYETGWKDTIMARPGEVMRLVTRWAPQETPTGGVAPGQNLFPIQPVSPTTDAWYLFHCHVLGHEDNDMMRKLPLVNLWAAGKAYVTGTVVAFQSINYRVRVNHTSTAAQTPNTRFDLWERVNNNDGTWQPQIIYAVGDRVLFNGKLFVAKAVHQAQTGQNPTVVPARWDSLPMTACAQISKLCADNTQDDALTCQGIGADNDDAACGENLDFCLAECDEDLRSPCSGLCANPTSFTVPDGTTFRSGALGTGAACFETTSELLTGTCTGLGAGRQITVNGKVQVCDGTNWVYPMPSQRNYGYCIQTTAGTGGASASFTAR